MNKKHNNSITVTIFIGLMTIIFCGTALAGDTVTITGTVNDDYILVDDEGEVYLIADSEKGHELAENAGVRVSVTGILEEDDNGYVLHIQSYKIIRE